jgi:hypothetical protein
VTVPVARFRRALVDHLGGALGLVGIPHPPATPQGGQLFFKPGERFLSWEEPGTFARPVLSFTLVLVAPTNDIGRTWEWIDEKVATLREALHTVERIGPFPRPRLLAIGGAGPLADTALYAAEVFFAPVPIGDLT